MAAAAKTILNELSALNASSSSVSRVIRTISQACVSGGRGNSGTLLTHFFAGLVEELESRLHNVADDKTVSVADMSLSLKGSGARMMEAYENAQEGTIVSVLRDSTAAANDGMHNSWTSFTSSWLSHARRLLERTPEDLVVDGEKILKTHFKGKSVVDSGAAGVVYLIEGIDMAASGSPCTFNIVSSDASTLTADSSGMLLTSAAAEHVNESLEGGGRYCTECIFSVNDNTTQQNIQQRIGSMGDSVVVVVAPGVETNSKYAKLHIHTNEPAEVFAAAECIANDNKLLKEKCEDMRGQVDCNNYPLPDDANRSVALVIYSSNDLPETLAQRMQLQRVCCFIYVNDVEMMDRREMNQDEFLCMLRHDDPVCKTAAPTKQMYIDAFSRAFDQLEQQHQQRAGDRVNEVLHLGPSRSLSEACWANSHAAAEALEPAERRGRVVIHDCRGISGIEAVLTLKAYELACQGKTAAEIVAALEDIRDRTNCLVAIPTLKYLQRGGRVNTSIATIGKLINLKVLLLLMMVLLFADVCCCYRLSCVYRMMVR